MFTNYIKSRNGSGYKIGSGQMLQSPLLRGISSRNSTRLVDGKEMRILELHLVFTFPCKFWSTLGFPTDFDKRNPASLQSLLITIHDFDGLFHEVHSFVDLDVFERNLEILVGKTSLQIWYVERWVDVTKFGGQVELVSDLSNAFQYLEWTNKAGS